jgi:hypothetical protein
MKMTISNVRLAFPKLWVPEPFPGGNDPTPYFSAIGILPPTHSQFAAINATIDAVAKAKWPKDWSAIIKAAKMLGKVPLRDGATKPDVEGYEGNWFISSRAKRRPTVVGPDRTPLEQSDGKPYGGCYVNLLVEFFAYAKGNKGVGCDLRGVQFVRDGDAFAGGSSAADPEEYDEISAPVEDDLTA